MAGIENVGCGSSEIASLRPVIHFCGSAFLDWFEVSLTDPSHDVELCMTDELTGPKSMGFAIQKIFLDVAKPVLYQGI